MTGRMSTAVTTSAGGDKVAGALRAVPSAQQPEIPGRASKRHMPREPATSAMRQQRPAQGTCPSPEQTPSSSRWRAWHSGCQRAPAIRRPEVETFRSARRTGAICGSPPNRPGGSGVRGRQAATAPSQLAAPRGAA